MDSIKDQRAAFKKRTEELKRQFSREAGEQEVAELMSYIPEANRGRQVETFQRQPGRETFERVETDEERMVRSIPKANRSDHRRAVETETDEVERLALFIPEANRKGSAKTDSRAR
ncbi:MAG: hypothetical protein AB7S38_18365 [Vulcanimicrobiota bacterium]